MSGLFAMSGLREAICVVSNYALHEVNERTTKKKEKSETTQLAATVSIHVGRSSLQQTQTTVMGAMRKSLNEVLHSSLLDQSWVGGSALPVFGAHRCLENSIDGSSSAEHHCNDAGNEKQVGSTPFQPADLCKGPVTRVHDH